MSLFTSILVVLPLILIVFLLYRNVNMIITGFIGGAFAIIISYLFLENPVTIIDANNIFKAQVPKMLGFTFPILNSALAMAVFKSGGYTSALTLAKKGVKGRVELLAVFIVLLQTAATYMSGIGGGSAMVIAPLAFAAVGVIPEVIAAMSIATAFAFTTSPASLESSIVAQNTNVGALVYAQSVQMITLGFVVLACILAYIGAKRSTVEVKHEETKFDKMSNKALFINTIPTIFLLFSVIFGPIVNKAVGYPVFNALLNIIATILLIGLCTSLTYNQVGDAIVDGSNYILTRLFGVGIFITFIYVIQQIGAFDVIVNAASGLPRSIILPALILAGFLIGVPSGAYVGAILVLILPIAVKFNLSLLGVGFIAMGVGLGSQMCFVNITMQALSTGFQIPILKVVKGNTKWVLIALGLLMGLSLFV